MTDLLTSRARLRRLRSDDFENMRSLESNPHVMKFTPARVPQTEEQTRERLASQISKEKLFAPYGIWAAEAHDGSLIGWFMLRPLLAVDGSVDSTDELEIGFMIVEAKWGQGLTTEIARGLIEFARGLKREQRFIAKTTLDNHVSMHVLKKLGFQQTESLNDSTDTAVNVFRL